jgi:hypothetical protein
MDPGRRFHPVRQHQGLKHHRVNQVIAMTT